MVIADLLLLERAAFSDASSKPRGGYQDVVEYSQARMMAHGVTHATKSPTLSAARLTRGMIHSYSTAHLGTLALRKSITHASGRR